MSSTSTPGTRSPTIAPACRHPVVGVGAPGPAVQRTRAGWSSPSAVSVDLAAERGDARRRARRAGRSRGRGGARCRAVGWGPPANSAMRGDGRGQLADVVQVEVHAVHRCRSRDAVSPSSIRSTLARPSRRGSRGSRRRPGWSRRGQLRDGHRPAGDRGGREKRRGVGQVGLDRRSPRARPGPARTDHESRRASRRRRPRPTAASRPSSRCAAWTARAARRGARRRRRS